MTLQVAVRLGLEGTDARKGLGDFGREGEAAFQRVEKAANEAGTAVERQEAKLRRLAEAARQGAAADAAQSRFNQVLGVGVGPGKDAAASAAVFEQAAAEAEHYEGRARALRAALDPVQAAQERLNAELTEYATLAQRGDINTAELAQAQVMARKRFDETTNAIQRQGAGLSKLERSSRLNLARQGADVFTTAAMGMNPAMIAVQQGPQIMDAMATSGIKLSRSMLLVGGTFAAVAATALVMTAAYNSGEAATRKMEVASVGLGAAARMSATQLEAAAEAGAAAGDVSVKAAREMAGAYVSTGRISGDVLTGLIGLTKDYAATTGIEATDATKQLGAAFADPVRGAAQLNAKLLFLSASEQKHIENLARAGDEAGAQRLMMDALTRSLTDAADATTGLGNAWDYVGRKVSDAWDWMGRALYRMASGGDQATKLANLTAERQRLAAMNPSAGSAFALQIKSLDAQIDELNAKMDAAGRRQASAAANQNSLEVQGILDSLNPVSAKLDELRGKQARLTAELMVNPFSAQTGEIVASLETVGKEIGALQAGYSSASAQASALNQNQRAAATSAREAAQEVEREADERARRIAALNDLELQNRLAIARAVADPEAIKAVEREARLRSLIATYEANGVESIQARANAQAQVTRETEAEAEAIRRKALANPEGFVSAEERMRPFQDLKLEIDDNTEALQRMKDVGVSAFDRFGDLLAHGNAKWNDWKSAGLAAIGDLEAEFVRLTALNPLKNWLFNQDNPTLKVGDLFNKGGKAAADAAAKAAENTATATAITTAGATAGATMATSIGTAGATAAATLGTSVGTAGATAAATMATAITTAGATAAAAMATAIAGGSAAKDGSDALAAFASAGANANGTPSWRGGLTWVGERGKELVDLPPGARVYDHGQSMAMATRTAAAAGRAQAPVIFGPGSIVFQVPSPQAYQASRGQIAAQMTRAVMAARRVT